MGKHLERAQIFISQRRFDLAEKEIRQELGSSPDDAVTQAMLALCLMSTNKDKDALETARRAVSLGPDMAYVHYVLALVLFHLDMTAQARKAIEEAIGLDPYESSYFELLARILLTLGHVADGLEAAEKGLEMDPENVDCENVRAYALTLRGRNEESGAGLEVSLARDPENAHTYAYKGWHLLDRHKHLEAADQFREALRIDPQLDSARQGLIEALKGQDLGFRVHLKALTGKTAAVFLFFLCISSWLAVLPREFHPVRLVSYGLTGMAGIFLAFLLVFFLPVIVLGEAVVGLKQHLHPARAAMLSTAERIRALTYVMLAALAVTAALAGFLLGASKLYLLSLLFLVLNLPAGQAFSARAGGPQRWMSIYTGVLAAAGSAAVVTAVSVSGWQGWQGMPYPWKEACLAVYGLSVVGALFSGVAAGLCEDVYRRSLERR